MPSRGSGGVGDLGQRSELQRGAGRKRRAKRSRLGSSEEAAANFAAKFLSCRVSLRNKTGLVLPPSVTGGEQHEVWPPCQRAVPQGTGSLCLELLVDTAPPSLPLSSISLSDIGPKPLLC